MAMPEKKMHRAVLLAEVEVLEEIHASSGLTKEEALDLSRARVLLALADAEWEREAERALEANIPPAQLESFRRRPRA